MAQTAQQQLPFPAQISGQHQSSSTHLPPGFTQEHAQQVFQRYQQLKKNGTPDNDPELKQLYAQLSMLKQRNQQRQAAQMAYQSHMAPQGAPNGASPPTSNSTAHLSPPLLQNAQAQNISMDMASRKQYPSGIPWVSDEMTARLRNQVKAYQLLSKNAPLSLDIQRAVFKSVMKKESPLLRESSDATTSALMAQAASSSAATSAQSVAVDERGSRSYASPYDHLRTKISYHLHRQRDERPLIPGIMPPGVDIEEIRRERETIIYNRIKERRSELEKEDANKDTWDTSKSHAPVPDGSRKRQALIEYKKLGLLQKQRNLRLSMGREMVMSDTLAMTANRASFRRQKKHDIREARFTEKLEKEQRSARENKEKEKHKSWLKQIQDHAGEIRDAAREQRARIEKFGKLMIAQHQLIEKEEQKRVERTAKQRLQALKANDEETYLKLLGQAKDSRISHLLKQTDSFLGQLADSVKRQQRSANEKWGNNREATPEVESEPEEGDEDAEERSKRVDYYEVAHKIKEEVKAQSSNLVGGTLKEYQLKGLQWMVSLYNNNLNGILADEMGLGKTIQTISLITYLIEKKRHQGPYLVIVPLSTLTNWTSEFEKWAPSVKRIIYKGTPNARKASQNDIRMGQFQVLLTTYEYIIKDRSVLGRVKWLHMIVDEGHRMKNAQSKLSSTITQYYTTRYRLILTGTPLQNNLPELWALLNFVLPTIFKSVKSFDEWFNTPFANTGGQDKMDLTEEEKILVIRRLHKVLRPFLLRRLKKDVEKDLPEKTERVIKCNFSSLQAKLYRQLGQRNQLMVSDGKGGKTGMRGLSNMLMQFRKLCNHPFVFEEVENQMNPGKQNNDLLWRTSGKFELLDRILPKFRATGHRVLMFFQMTQIMNIMEDFLRLRGFSYLRLDGSTKSDERSDLLGLFNAENSPYFCFLLSTRAGGLGLNLQTADTVIIYDSDWNPFQDLQAQDRAHRIGQKNEVRILRLITSNSVEEKILERAQYKLGIDSQVIQAGKFDNKSTNEERDAMLRVMLETVDAAENLENEEMDDDDLNQLMARSDAEIDVFQKFDEERAADPMYGPGKRLPRLMGDDELPDIYVNEDGPTVDEVEEIVGRGARERTRVKYDDGLTEEQWLDAVDNDEDTIEDAIARKTEKIKRRQANKNKRGGMLEGLGDSPAPSRESSASPTPKKRGQRSKRKADEMSIDSGDAPTPPVPAGPPSKKRGRQAKATETLTPSERDALQISLDKVFDDVEALEVPDAERGGGASRPIIDLFVALPDRKIYADYYLLIKDPISMDIIAKKINDKRYQSLNAFAKDMRLLVANCRTYNEDGSMLYADAGTIQDSTLRMLREEQAKHGAALGNAGFREEDEEDAKGANGFGDSTRATSAAGTPAPGTKLKLNLGAR